mmetsp:Transcript_45250/g.73697  ORF Transcript_45250/g.73697 Transcript_45250/m.73697 type:complete len:225 (+) Transcript_45250:1718-2392(+)
MGFFVGVPIFLFVRIRVRVGDGFRDGVRLFVGERFFDGVRIEGDGFRDGVLRVCVAEGRFAEKVGRIDFVGEVRFAVKVGRIVFVGDGFFDGVLLVREGEAFLGELVGGRMVFDGDWARVLDRVAVVVPILFLDGVGVWANLDAVFVVEVVKEDAVLLKEGVGVRVAARVLERDAVRVLGLVLEGDGVRVTARVLVRDAVRGLGVVLVGVGVGVLYVGDRVRVL